MTFEEWWENLQEEIGEEANNLSAKRSAELAWEAGHEQGVDETLAFQEDLKNEEKKKTIMLNCGTIIEVDKDKESKMDL